MKPGDMVKLQLTPFDLSTGRLLSSKENDLT
jgi:translation initiation factor IF-1